LAGGETLNEVSSRVNLSLGAAGRRWACRNLRQACGVHLG
jgi:hypothetical protein